MTHTEECIQNANEFGDGLFDIMREIFEPKAAKRRGNYWTRVGILTLLDWNVASGGQLIQRHHVGNNETAADGRSTTTKNDRILTYRPWDAHLQHKEARRQGSRAPSELLSR